MSASPGKLDWAADRGEKWRRQLAAMEAMLAPVDAPLIDALRLDVPCRIADLACGGGGTTLEILRRAPAGSVVHGYDISPALIEAARARATANAAVAFELADVSRVPAGMPYERLASRFGVMFFDEPPSAFRNLLHWLAPGGRFAFAVWAPPADNPWMTAVREAVAEVIEVPKPDPDAPGPFRYADAGKLLDLLGGAGFHDLQLHDWRGLLAIGGGVSADAAAEFSLAAFSVAEPLAHAGEPARRQALKALAARYAQHERAGQLSMPARVHLISGGRER